MKRRADGMLAFMEIPSQKRCTAVKFASPCASNPLHYAVSCIHGNVTSLGKGRPKFDRPLCWLRAGLRLRAARRPIGPPSVAWPRRPAEPRRGVAAPSTFLLPRVAPARVGTPCRQTTTATSVGSRSRARRRITGARTRTTTRVHLGRPPGRRRRKTRSSLRWRADCGRRAC